MVALQIHVVKNNVIPIFTYVITKKLLQAFICCTRVYIEIIVSIHTADIVICRYVGTFRPFLYTAWATTRMVTSIDEIFVAYFCPSMFSHHGLYSYTTGVPLETHVLIYFHNNMPLLVITVINVHMYAIVATTGLVYEQILREALWIQRQMNTVVTDSLDRSRDDSHQSQKKRCESSVGRP